MLHVRERLSYISTHSLLAEGDLPREADLAVVDISTHSLLAEGDSTRCRRR